MKFESILLPDVNAQRPIVIAGPCSAETEEQVMETAKGIASKGIKIFRAGIWKPRTKPGGFEGVGAKGLPWLKRVKKETGMYAECLIETNGDKQLAVDLINKVRHRAFVTTTPTDSYAKYRKFNVAEDKRVTEDIFNAKYKVKVTDDLRAAVRHERRVELACEGLRYFDLVRWKTFVPTMQAFSKTEEGKHSGAGSIVTDKTWPYPIPQNEIDYVGGSLTQNENY